MTDKLITNPAELAAHYGLPWPADACVCCGGKIVDGRCLGAEKCDEIHDFGALCAGLEAPEPEAEEDTMSTESKIDEIAPAPDNADLRSEIKTALNRHSAENGSNTPDHVLADYLLDCLDAFDAAVLARGDWYGRHDAPGQTLTKEAS